MFLTKKSLRKIRLLVGADLLVAAFSFLSAIVFALLEMEYLTLVLIGCLCLVLAFLSYKTGHYAESKGKLIAEGNKLLTQELRPNEFIRLYEEKSTDQTNVITKPDSDVLQLLLTAYDVMGEQNRALEIAEQLLTIAPTRKLNIVKILKCSLLFNTDRTDEAENLYREVINGEMDMITKNVADILMKTDRALSLGDYTTAECYFNQSLTQKFPKPTPLSKLSAHYHLAKICYKTGRTEEAEEHRKYCIENGGETGMQREAANGEIYK